MEGTLFAVWMVIVGTVVIASIPLNYWRERQEYQLKEKELALRWETNEGQPPKSVKRRGILNPVDTDSEAFRKKYARRKYD